MFHVKHGEGTTLGSLAQLQYLIAELEKKWIMTENNDNFFLRFEFLKDLDKLAPHVDIERIFWFIDKE
jgi:hypothetical protein